MYIPESIKKVGRKFRAAKIQKAMYASDYKIEGNIQNKEKMLYILSGYKPYLWKDVFTRVKLFQTSDMEVCIASSGKYCQELSDLCKKNGWVYLSTSRNNVCIMTNIIMKVFSKAEYIFKMDEDVYLPEHYFENMFNAYKRIESETNYSIGYILPYQPLGVYAMYEFLDERGLIPEFESKFGKITIGGTFVNPFLRKDCGVDAYIWEKMGPFDKLANEYADRPFEYEPCVTRPCIASILFTRRLWDQMGGFKATRGAGVGDVGDEGQITSFCALNYQVAFCVKNILIGHFAFGGAEPSVLKFKEKHPDYFELKIDGRS